MVKSQIQSHREKGAGGTPAPHHFLEQKIFFTLNWKKQIFVKFLHVNNICDFNLFIEHDISDKKKSFFWLCCFSSKLSYNSYQQQVCKFLFLK